MRLNLYRLDRGVAVALLATAITPSISGSARAADLRLPTKPAAQRQPQPEERAHLYEKFQRYIEQLKQ